MQILIVLASFFSSALAFSGSPLVGGPCTYTATPGTMIISKVAKTKGSKAQASSAGYEGYEVTFKFTTKARVSNDWREYLKRAQTFTLLNGWHPGERYIKKYGIAEGKTFPCTLELIKTGTCSPVIFTFKGLDPVDYFESKK
jgi:hypothetical protein